MLIGDLLGDPGDHFLHTPLDFHAVTDRFDLLLGRGLQSFEVSLNLGHGLLVGLEVIVNLSKRVLELLHVLTELSFKFLVQLREPNGWWVRLRGCLD